MRGVRRTNFCGALAKIFSEVDALYGIPQPPRWHPEIDTGVHVMLVVRYAAKINAPVIVRFAALVHDLELAPGREVVALIKATFVALAPPECLLQ